MKRTLIAGIAVASLVFAPAMSSAADSTVVVAQRSMSASKLLLRSANALSGASSYQAGGTVRVKSTGGSGKATQEKVVTMESAFQKDAKVYVKTTVTAPKQGTLENYSDGTAVYMKATGSLENENIPSGQWVKKETTKSGMSGNPLTNIQLVSSMGTVTGGDDATLDGKTYKRVNVELTSELARSLMGMALATAEQDISTTYQTDIDATSDAKVTIQYYIDPTTYITEVAKFDGSEKVTTDKAGTMTISVSGELRISGVNQPVTMPDVSGAKTVERKKRAR